MKHPSLNCIVLGMALIFTIIATGCKRDPGSTPVSNIPTTPQVVEAATVPVPPKVAPHGGVLVALGDGFAHVEFLIDSEEKKIHAYVLDEEAKEPIYIEQPAIRFYQIDTHKINSKGETVGSTGGSISLDAGEDRTITFWNAITGKATVMMPGYPGEVNNVAFSPDGKQIASGSTENTIKIWNADTSKETFTLKGHTERVNSVTFSSDGKQIATGSRDKTIKIWDVATGEEILTLNGHTESVNSVVFSPDGKQIVSGSRDKTIKTWDVSTGEEIQTLKGPTESVNSVAFSPDGKQIVTESAKTISETVRVMSHFEIDVSLAWFLYEGEEEHEWQIEEITVNGQTFKDVSFWYPVTE